MDPISDLLNLSQMAATTHAKKDKKQRNQYPKRSLNLISSVASDINYSSEDVQWTKEDRRAGEDRRLIEKARHQRFEYRDRKDRRKTKTLFIKV